MRSRKNTLVFLRVESLAASANGSAGLIVNGIAVVIANGSMAEKDGLPLQKVRRLIRCLRFDDTCGKSIYEDAEDR